MKVAPSAVKAVTQPRAEIPLLPLVPEKVKYAKEDRLVFKLRLIPDDETSTTFDYIVPKVRGTESVRVAIGIKEHLEKVWEGMNVLTAEAKDKIVQQVLRDQALDQYRNGTEVAAIAAQQRQRNALVRNVANGETPAQFRARVHAIDVPDMHDDFVEYGLNKAIMYMVPSKALPRIKRYLRRKCRKPQDMKVREFFNHLCRINMEELPKIPPVSPNNALSGDEIIDILLFAFPQSWQSEMNRQGFDPTDHTPMQLIDFCERMELAEAMDADKNTKKVSTKTNKTEGRIPKKQKTSGEPKFYCKTHGKNYSHNTEDCRVGKSKNKSWSRKAEDGKKQAKDLASFIKKTIKAELNAIDKKRKSSDTDSVSSEEGEVNAVDELDPARIDFSKMSVDSDSSRSDDDDVSV